MRIILSVLIIICCSFGLQAQYFEIGIGGGLANYSGDLSENSSRIILKESGLAGTAFIRYNLPPMVSVRLGFNYAKISGNDANAQNENIALRNLSFQSNIYEGSLIGEINLPGYDPYNLSRPFSPYFFAGVAFFGFNPTTDYNGSKVELQPLGTEGQGLANNAALYNTTAFAIPLGLGFKYALTDLLNISLEMGARRTFTDFLDDVSGNYADIDLILEQRGETAADLSNRSIIANPDELTGTPRGDFNSNDWFYTLQLTISYNFFDNGLVGSRGRQKRKQGCRTD